MAHTTARCSAKLCQREERSHNCSLWARSGALPLCYHPLYSRLRYTRLFGNCTLCGVAARLHDSNAPAGQLPTMPTRDEQVQCAADDSLTTDALLQARAEQDVAKGRLERCACGVRTAVPPVLPEWNASWSKSDSTALRDYSEAYMKALIFALEGFDGLCTPDGLRMNVSVARVFGAGVNNLVFAAHRADAPSSSTDLVVRIRVGQLEPAVGTARGGRPLDFDVPSLPPRFARLPPFLLAQPEALVAAGTCTWPASKRWLFATVLPRGAATQADMLAPRLARVSRARRHVRAGVPARRHLGVAAQAAPPHPPSAIRAGRARDPTGTQEGSEGAGLRLALVRRRCRLGASRALPWEGAAPRGRATAHGGRCG